MPQPRITREQFEFLARRAGLTLSDQQKSELYGAYGHLEALIERLRTRLPLAAEPATIFTLDEGGGP